MAGQVSVITNVLASHILTGFNRQIRSGEAFALWTYDDILLTDRYLPVRWNARNKQLVAGRLAQAVADQVFTGQGDLDLAVAGVNRLIAGADSLTVFILNDGTRAVKGTAFDAQINAAYAPLSGLASTSLYLTTLMARSGQVIAWSVQRTQPVQPAEIASGGASDSRLDRSGKQPAWTRVTGARPIDAPLKPSKSAESVAAPPEEKVAAPAQSEFAFVQAAPAQKALRGELPVQPVPSETLVHESSALDRGLPDAPSDGALPQGEAEEPGIADAQSVASQAASDPVLSGAAEPADSESVGDSGDSISGQARLEPIKQPSDLQPAVSNLIVLSQPAVPAGDSTKSEVEAPPAPAHTQVDSEVLVEQATVFTDAPVPVAASAGSPPGSNPRKFLVLGLALLVMGVGGFAWFARSGNATGGGSLISRSLDAPQK